MAVHRAGFTGTATLRLAPNAPPQPGPCSGPWPGSPGTAGPGRRPPTDSARPPVTCRKGAAMGEMLERAFTEQRLLDAWAEVRDAALADGEAGRRWSGSRPLPRVTSASSRERWQTGRSSRIRWCGWRSPSQVAGVRRLAVPSLTDRIVERALLAELDAVIDPLLLPWSFAYRHGLGVRDALACLAEARDAGAAWVARVRHRRLFRPHSPLGGGTAAAGSRARRGGRGPGPQVHGPAGRRASMSRGPSAAWACTRAARCRRCSATCTWMRSTGPCSRRGTGRSGTPMTSRSR